jgi:uncharacterized membrane protein YjgN (DUF898 family)
VTKGRSGALIDGRTSYWGCLVSSVITAIKLSIALAIGLIIDFESQRSNKNFGVRTFSFAALLGALTALISAPMMLVGLGGIIAFAVVLTFATFWLRGLSKVLHLLL